MLAVTDKCVIKIKESGKEEPLTFAIDTDIRPNQKFLLGKKIGERFSSDILKSRKKGQTYEYEIIEILPSFDLKNNSRINKNLSYYKTDKNKKYEQMEVLKFFKSRGCKYLIHFTRIENVDSIMKYGICSRDECARKGIKAAITDSERYDELYDYSCFSVEFPNYRMRCKKEKEYSMKLAILLIDISVLGDIPYEKVFYSFSNSASSQSFPKRGIEGAKSLFTDEELRLNLGLPDEYTTNPQAEVLIKNIIHPKYIEAIHVEAESDLKLFNSRAFVNSKYFTYRNDYAYWK